MAASGGDRPTPTVTRRGMLQLGGGAGATALAAGALDARPATARAPLASLAPAPSFTTMIRRREDQLSVRLDCYGLTLATDPARLVALPRQRTYQVVVTFTPQHLGEEAVYELSRSGDQGDLPQPPDPPDPPPEPRPLPPLGVRLADGSRLAFTVPASALPIPFTLEALLDWAAWTPSVVPSARGSLAVDPPRGTPRPQLVAPSPRQTAIELPWWLLLSPSRLGAWVHAADAVTHAGRTELWHTRLGGHLHGIVDEDDAARRTVRAVWARDPTFAAYLAGGPVAPADGEDFEPPRHGMPFRTSVSPRDRFDLVLSSAYYKPGLGGTYRTPDPIEVDHLTLSSLGASTDAHQAWVIGNAPAGLENNLESWRHSASGGRDQYVRVVRSGNLCGLPFGASLFKVTERTFRTTPGGRRVAYLVQRYFVGLREREIVLDGSHQPNDGRAFPFTRLRAKTMVTPTIDPPATIPFLGINATRAFVVRLGGQVFCFHVEAVDRAGRTLDLQVPAVFVDSTISRQVGGQMATLRDWYNGVSPHGLDVDAPERVVDVRGQRLAPAPPTEPGGSDTDLEVHRMTLGLEPPILTDAQLKAQSLPGYVPTMAEAEVRLAAAEALLGQPLDDELPVFVLDPTWVDLGFGKPGTRGEVFVRLKDPANPGSSRVDVAAAGAGDRSGGLAVPSLAITALSRRTGAVGGDPDTFQGGALDPSQFFGGIGATLLGDVPLAQAVVPGQVGDGHELTLRRSETADAFVTLLDWSPRLTSTGPFLATAATTLDLRATLSAPKADPQDVTSLVTGELRNFSVRLLPGATFLTVAFNRMRFRSADGGTPDVDVEIRDVTFDGALSFVEALKDYLGFDSGGFSVDVTPTAVDAGLELPIPSIPLGVFSLQNLAFRAGAIIPFTGDPVRFRFGFNSVDDPFLVSVMIFGGGGSFQLAVGTDGVESFELALEFGFVGALDVGVASGSVSITAGIYLAIGVANPPDNPDGACELTGFLKIQGEVEVLGLISLGLFMKASFTYIPAIGKAIVKATIVVEVDVLGFGGEVEIEYEKSFGGGSSKAALAAKGPPAPGTTFGESMSAAQWAQYAAAFAPVGS